ncbi:hypothetical protein [Halodesulfovibrio aestuarii]|uniref:Uncharacterized protein n=1 Tax=Halodesulfovibrio aestuarii TaxID=126333 RepID=A0ABV4JMV4_9BACT
MQDIDARLLLFKLSSCGWYKKRTQHVSHNPLEAFTALQDWVSARDTIEETHIFETEENEAEADPIYVYDIQKSPANNFLLTLWVGTHTDDKNQLLAVNKFATPGSIQNNQIKTQKFDDNYLPGFPHYFWIVPEKDLVISLYFGAVHSGFIRLRTYMKTFIQDYTLPPKSTRETINGIPKFAGSRIKKSSHIPHLKSRINFISYILLKKNLTMSVKTDRSYLTKLLDLVADASGNIIDKKSVLVETKLNITPTETLFDEIVDHWHEMPEDKIGFKFSDEENITYLDENLIKGGAYLENIEDNSAGILDAKALLHALDKQQTRILNQVNIN